MKIALPTVMMRFCGDLIQKESGSGSAVWTASWLGQTALRGPFRELRMEGTSSARSASGAGARTRAARRTVLRGCVGQGMRCGRGRRARDPRTPAAASRAGGSEGRRASACAASLEEEVSAAVSDDSFQEQEDNQLFR